MDGTDGNTNGLLEAEAAIQPFLDILKEDSVVNLSTLRSIVLKILVHPELFCGFDQFKSLCSSLLQGDATAVALGNTLDLFSYGSLRDYTQKQQQAPDYYLPLNDLAQTKLGQLTVLTCIQEACFHGATRISYAALAESLGWINAEQPQQDDGWIRNVEDILIRCLYAKALKGKLCQRTRSFGWETESLPVVCARDVPTTQIPRLLAALKGLGRRLESSENEVAQAQGQVTQGLEEASQFWCSIQEKKKTAQSESMFKGSGAGGAASQQRPFGFDPSGGDSRSAARSSSSRSSKRSRGGFGGNFATDTAFRL
mmetsp:Transcript_21743/g.35001  ORF Transcript_21743/g.35001 Transcript_21743/m.35001 type:complete len:312 (+) Transcript_21743:36-971(+)